MVGSRRRELSWTAPFTGLVPRAFGKLVTMLRRAGADAFRRGRPWSLPLEGQGTAGRGVLAYKPDPSAARSAVRGVEVGGGPDHRPSRAGFAVQYVALIAVGEAVGGSVVRETVGQHGEGARAEAGAAPGQAGMSIVGSR